MKKKIYNLYGFVNTLKYPNELKATVKSMFDEKVFDNKTHLKLAADWLLFMQNDDGGYSRKFSFISRRDKSYIETTGYIIPSMYKVGEFLKNINYINSAKRAGEFLLKIQNEDGSFSEIDNNTPFAFDTGQCLIGLNFLYEKTNDEKYFEAAKKASYWLKNNQEKHTYYSRVAAAMFKFAEFSEDKELQKSALKNINWVLSNQMENGFFKYSSFIENFPAYLHTLIYVLEGLLDVYVINKDEEILKSILKNAENFKEKNLNKDLILCSQYDKNFNCVNKERCITGLAQWARVAIRLYKITNDKDYLICAKNTIFYLKAKQIKESKMKGGFSASIPFWGKYGSFDFVNWSNKFFIDALLEYNDFYISKIDEQENFVSIAFRQTENIVTDNISYMDSKYLNELKQILENKPLKILDIGCGKGVIINKLAKTFKNIEFFGVDPVFENENIKKGSVYNIPFENEYFDIVMSFEVLQHTYIEESLKEINRVVKKNGKIIIGERNPFSILGIFKPILELKNKWMYPWDSPFREKWYSKTKWIEILNKNGFKDIKIKVIEGSGKKLVNRYFFIEGIKV